MNWYRVTFAKLGKRLSPVELPAHDVDSALRCALVKAKLSGEEDIEVADLDCIEDPEHAKALARLKRGAAQAANQLSEKLEEAIFKGDAKNKPAGDA